MTRLIRSLTSSGGQWPVRATTAIPLMAALGLLAQNATAGEPVQLTDEARQLHADALVVDGHNDLPWKLREDAGGDLSRVDIAINQPTLHTDLPRLKQGGMDVQFWSVWVPTSTSRRGKALLTTLEQIDLVERMVQRYPNELALARSVAEVRHATAEGKIASLIGVEGGHCIEGSLGTLKQLYRRGARYMTLTHSTSLDWADSATDDARNGGLTEFGEEVVRQMNQLGMMVDISHVSPATMHQALDITTAPVIFSHSSCRAVTDHPRNVPDDVLRRLADNGGVVMINFFPSFIVQEAAETHQARVRVQQELRRRYPDDEQRVELELKRWTDIQPDPSASIGDVLDHIDHAVRVAGVEHVGLGSDFDGIPSVPTQLEDVSRYPYLTQGLLDRGYSHPAIRKILGGNFMRVFEQVEKASVAADERAPREQVGRRTGTPLH